VPIGGEIKEAIPWWLKLSAKVCLARLPMSYRFWKRLHLFEHGRIDNPQVAYDTYRTHLELAGFQCTENHSAIRSRSDFVVVELGPGDSLYTALIAYAYGASRCYLLDVGDFANRNLGNYVAMARFLAGLGLEVPSFNGVRSVDEILARCNAVYLTDGIASLQSLPTGSVDLVFSNAVLEHVRKKEIAQMVSEMHRCLKPHGRCSHRVDLQDHLGSALNNLRFSERVWESEFMAQSGFYTNRLRCREWAELFERAGFDVEIKRTLRWDRPHTPRNKLHSSFQSLSDDDLLVYGFDVVLRSDGSC